MGKFIDLTGLVFERLTVLEPCYNKNGRIAWLCSCTCNTKIIIRGNHLTSGSTKSCGCLRKQGNYSRHRHTINKVMSKTYAVWHGMIQRCCDPCASNYKNYGGRNPPITVCDRWLSKNNGFQNFLEDMGERPKGKTLDRIKNDLGYYKENCRWATRKEQSRNTRRNRYFTFNGETLLLIEFSEKYGIKYSTLKSRIRLGWSIEDAISLPVKKYKGN